VAFIEPLAKIASLEAQDMVFLLEQVPRSYPSLSFLHILSAHAYFMQAYSEDKNLS